MAAIGTALVPGSFQLLDTGRSWAEAMDVAFAIVAASATAALGIAVLERRRERRAMRPW